MQETRCESPTETSRHSTVRQEICIFSKLLNLISGNLTSNEISQKAKHDLQKILAWFIIDCFVHNIDLIALSRKSFRPQNSDNETVLADEIDYNRDPDWSHPLFIKTLTDISSQAVTTIFIKKDNVKITHLLLMQHPASSTKNNSSILTSPFITTEVIYIYDRFTKRHLDTSHYITIFLTGCNSQQHSQRKKYSVPKSKMETKPNSITNLSMKAIEKDFYISTLKIVKTSFNYLD